MQTQKRRYSWRGSQLTVCHVERVEICTRWLLNKWIICRRLFFYTHDFEPSNSSTSCIHKEQTAFRMRWLICCGGLCSQRRCWHSRVDHSLVWHLRGGFSQFTHPQCSQRELKLSNSHANASTKCFPTGSLLIINIWFIRLHVENEKNNQHCISIKKFFMSRYEHISFSRN